MGRVRTTFLFLLARTSLMAKAQARCVLPHPAGPRRKSTSCWSKAPQAIFWAWFKNSRWNEPRLPGLPSDFSAGVFLFAMIPYLELPQDFVVFRRVEIEGSDSVGIGE